MTGFGRRKLEVGIGAQRLAELVAARALALRRAVDEREMLVRVRAIRVIQPEVEGGLQAAGRFRILATIVLPQPEPERAVAIVDVERRAELIAKVAHGLRAAPRQCHQQPDGDEDAHSHRKRCRILTASPALSCTFSTCAGKVELRISTVCSPGATSSTRSGGLTPRLLPSTSTSPQGATASSTRALPAPPPAAAGCLSRRASFLASGASALAGASTRLAAAAGAGSVAAGFAGGVVGSSSARAPTPPARIVRNSTPAASKAERRSPSGPLRASQPAGASPSSDCVIVSASRRLAGVPPTTEYTSCSRTCLSVRAPSW